MRRSPSEEKLVKIKKKRRSLPGLSTPTTDDENEENNTKVMTSAEIDNRNMAPGVYIVRHESALDFKPYEFQVAGHAALLKANSGKLFKPLKKQEFGFYSSVPQTFPSLLPFIPGFLGRADITQTQLRLLEEGALNNSPPTRLVMNHHHHETLPLEDWNPWSIQMHKARLLEINEVHEEKEPCYSYLVLQDLTHDYKRPSILDLKMGTKQFGDNASPKKQQSKTMKCIGSTSFTLGFRIAGMQLWDPTTKTFKHLHKYDARGLSSASLEQSLRQFFWNSITGIRRDVIIPILEKTKELLALLSSPHTKYRFYSTSLLLLYEGDIDNTDTQSKNDVRMIDFAHTFPKGDKEDDSGYVIGLRNLIVMLEKMLAEQQ
eukprot:TRINITY_DN3029_c0_g1_i1.p1 TRINITY_DN3029_c0_g1~~TRINITY_DN3029_c0_g1_i1.p1  ORF type:complete len:374 (+),score=71.36 TRINITY_DN3029_c0_g1_i1:505-1626(+)